MGWFSRRSADDYITGHWAETSDTVKDTYLTTRAMERTARVITLATLALLLGWAASLPACQHALMEREASEQNAVPYQARRVFDRCSDRCQFSEHGEQCAKMCGEVTERFIREIGKPVKER